MFGVYGLATLPLFNAVHRSGVFVSTFAIAKNYFKLHHFSSTMNYASPTLFVSFPFGRCFVSCEFPSYPPFSFGFLCLFRPFFRSLSVFQPPFLLLAHLSA